MKKQVKWSTLLLAVLLFLVSFGHASYAAQPTEIRQVNVHVGPQAETTRNITWSTQEQKNSTVIVKNGEEVVFTDTLAGKSNGKVITYQSQVTGLKPNTVYTYEITNGDSSQSGTFRTSKAKNEAGPIRFAMIADPQVNNSNDAKGAASNFNYINQYAEKDPLDFLFIAGDHTDNKGNETQWDLLFDGAGRYAGSGQETFLKNTILSTQGNHDSVDLDGHINMPGIGEGKYTAGTYSANMGNVKFITLNTAPYPKSLEELNTDEDYQKMVQFLKDEVADAKKHGMWTVVGYHKPLYTGASHMRDSDMRYFRQSLQPIFTELDVDVVLAGHDHVYTRAFVDADGNKASKEIDSINGVTTFEKPQNVPFHLVGGHAGGLKWYSTTLYPTFPGDPLIANYAFADKNSAQEVPPSADLKEQTFLVVEINGDIAHFSAYTSKYNDDETLQKAPELYDEFYIQRKAPQTKVVFTIADEDANKGEFTPGAFGMNETTLEVQRGSNAADLKTLAPKITAKDGYVFKGWDQAFEGKIIGDTVVYTAVFEKQQEPEPTPTPKPEIIPEVDPSPTPWITGWNFPIRQEKKEEKPVVNQIEIVDIKGHWAEQTIRTVVEKGYMDLEGKNFYPNRDGSRFTFVKAMARLSGVDPREYMDLQIFSDVQPGTIEAGYINWAAKKGIVAGTGEGKLEADRPITRQEIAAILNRFTNAISMDLPKKEVEPYADQHLIADWALADVMEARQKGIFSGKDNNMFDPVANITRGEMAQVVLNLDTK